MLPVSRLVSFFLRRKGKWAFLRRFGKKPSILDIGCGNQSPNKTKMQLPDSYYCGVDVSEATPETNNFADRYIQCEPESFSKCIESIDEEFDVVISSHNLEHCFDRWSTLESMTSRVKSGGSLYLAFPAEISVNFPSRDSGCLNYYDNEEHLDSPPDFSQIIDFLEEKDFEITFSCRQYRPTVLWAIGLISDRFHRHFNRVGMFTWEFFGFESIIWAKKIQ
tara:strand:- start:117 stop:779 length:663 start_codon:yes stop_codon:yes gene_type:complete